MKTSCGKAINRFVIASLIIFEIYLVDFVRPIRQIYSGFGSPETDRCKYGPNRRVNNVWLKHGFDGLQIMVRVDFEEIEKAGKIIPAIL